MASAATPLAHRSVASIRPQSQFGPSTPHTPPRNAPSAAYGSPSTIRADDDVVVVELGTRHLRVGFAGDAAPKATMRCSPDDQRRAGDYRSWQGGGAAAASPGTAWAGEHEFWRYDLRDLDLGLCQDRLERVLRDAFMRFLLIDSRPRRIGLVLDSAVPVPLLAAVLDTIFNRFQAPTVSLMAAAVNSTVAAGVRSGLVVNMGWAETVVTSVYEYREVKSTRTVRGGRHLLDELYKTLVAMLRGEEAGDEEEAGQGQERAISFAECEDIMNRLLWCRPATSRVPHRQSTQLETVEEQDESDVESADASQPSGGVVTVPIHSTTPPRTLEIPTETLSEVCDDGLFGSARAECTFDDNELPLHLLVYQHLLQLPIDARATCMSRIIFTGGCSNILGVRQRIVDEVSAMVDKRGWTPVAGKGVDRFRNNPKLARAPSSPPSDGAVSPGDAEEPSDKPKSAADAGHEYDAIEAKVMRHREAPPHLQGQIRVLHSLGAWVGGSLLCQLKVPAQAVIDREMWLQQGAGGAARPSDADPKTQQRHSAPTGGYSRSSGGYHGTWTLGTWGYLS